MLKDTGGMTYCASHCTAAWTDTYNEEQHWRHDLVCIPLYCCMDRHVQHRKTLKARLSVQSTVLLRGQTHTAQKVGQLCTQTAQTQQQVKQTACCMSS